MLSEINKMLSLLDKMLSFFLHCGGFRYTCSMGFYNDGFCSTKE